MEADVALLQEARPPAAAVGISLHDINDPGEWPEGRAGRVAIVRLSDRFTVEFIEPSFTKTPNRLAAARVRPQHVEEFIAVSICAEYEYPHALVPGRMKNVDSSLHRSISDLSAFIGRPKHHRVIVAGDFTVMRGPSEYRDAYWSAREQTIFDRMDALGLQCVGPEGPHGRQADPWPRWLPRGQQERADIPQDRDILGGRGGAARLRLRVEEHGRRRARACPQQRRSRMGAKRPLPVGHRSRMTPCGAAEPTPPRKHKADE